MKDLRKIRLMAIIASVTACLLMFSVGFSVWFKVEAPEPVTPDEDGSFEAYDVLTIHMKTPDGMEIFEYSALSFRDAAGASTSSGQINVNYVVPESTVTATGGNFTVDVTLTYETLSTYAAAEGENFKGLFASLGKGTETNQVSVTSSEGTVSNYTVSADNITAKLTFSDITVAENENYEFTLTYNFNIPQDITQQDSTVKGNFRQIFGKYLNVTSTEVTEPTKFIVTAQVTKTPAT